MTRVARIVVPDVPHHVTQRGVRRQTTFHEPADYQAYLSMLAGACRRSGTRVWAYCLMPNHVHFVMVPSVPDGLRAALGAVHRQHAENINRRFGWQGHLWQARFYSCPMDERHLLAAVRYVECNPVRAGLTRTAAEWPWSSARAHLCGRDDELVEVTPMRQRIADWSTYLAESSSGEFLENVSRHTRSGRPLGAGEFVQSLENRLGRTLAPRPAGRKRKENR
ncbi:MAG: hypothetical protein RL434_1703 [Pseudomonadota bacterium]